MDPLFKKSQQFNKLRILAAIMNLKKENPATSFFLEPSKNHRSNHRLLLPIETGEKKQKKRIVRIKQQSILIYADPLQVGARYDLCEIPGETDSWYAQLQTGHAK